MKTSHLSDSGRARQKWSGAAATRGGGHNRPKRNLRAGQLTLMTLGGIIGSGLFLASGQAIRYAGPGVAVGYLIGALAMAIEIAALAEMAAAEPVAGSFISYSRKAVGPGAAFVGGWIFWFSSVLNLGAEATAGGIFARAWLPHIPTFVFSVGFSIIIVGLNSLTVKGFGTVEAAMAGVKLAAIILFVLAALAAALGAWHPHAAAALASHPAGHLLPFFPRGFPGVAQAMILVTFSMAGTGIIGMAAAESVHPEHSVAESIHRTVAFIFVLYAAAALAITLWVPFSRVPTAKASPFVAALHTLGLSWGATIFNAVILIAVLSAMSAGLFATDRVLYALSRTKDAPSFFNRMTSKGVPLRANLATGAFLVVVSFLVYFLPKTAFLYLVTSTGFQALFIWGLIVYTQICYRRHLTHEKGQNLRLRVPYFPWASWFELALLLAIVATAFFTPKEVLPLLLGVVVVAIFAAIFAILRPDRRRGDPGGGPQASGPPGNA